MSPLPVDRLPDESRVWIWGAHRVPDADEAARLLDATRAFLEEWAAHGSPLRAGLDWRHHRFLLVAVDESRAAASGCSIDAVTDHLTSLERELGIDLLDTSPVWFRDPDRAGLVRTVSRAAFRRLAEEGRVDGDTVVFDLTVDRLGDVRAGAWELPASESWHASLLPDPADAAATPGGA